MIELINSRKVPDLFKDLCVIFFLFSYSIVLVCIVLHEFIYWEAKERLQSNLFIVL